MVVGLVALLLCLWVYVCMYVNEKKTACMIPKHKEGEEVLFSVTNTHKRRL